MSNLHYQHHTVSDPGSTPSGVHSTPPGGSGAPSGNFWKYFLAVLLSAAVTFVFTLGFAYLIFTGSRQAEQLQQTKPPAPIETRDGELALTFPKSAENETAIRKLRTILDHLKNDYYRELSDAELLELMAEGVANATDSPYTVYLTRERYEAISQSLKGNYSGIGAVVSQSPAGRQYTIAELLDNSPALEAGLQVGDQLIEVNGKPTSEFLDVSELAVQVRGPENTTVKIKIHRPSTFQTLDFTVTRRQITNATVRTRMVADEIGYLRVTEFSEGVSEKFRDGLQELMQQGARKVVIDLRGNGGGLADECVAMLDLLLPRTVLATYAGRINGKPFERNWTSGPSMGVPEEMSYAILLNEYSASASELFSGSLRDHDKAVLIGEKSFGKGSGTYTYALEDGSALIVTNFLYYLPKDFPQGISIEGKGLKPDHEVKLPESAVGKAISQLEASEDTQLAKAIDVLSSQLK